MRDKIIALRLKIDELEQKFYLNRHTCAAYITYPVELELHLKNAKAFLGEVLRASGESSPYDNADKSLGNIPPTAEKADLKGYLPLSHNLALQLKFHQQSSEYLRQLETEATDVLNAFKAVYRLQDACVNELMKARFLIGYSISSIKKRAEEPIKEDSFYATVLKYWSESPAISQKQWYEKMTKSRQSMSPIEELDVYEIADMYRYIIRDIDDWS